MSVEHSLLGKDTQYPSTYQPDILFPIARAQARSSYAHIEGIQALTLPNSILNLHLSPL